MAVTVAIVVAVVLGYGVLLRLWYVSETSDPEGAAVVARLKERAKARWLSYWRRVAAEVHAGHPAHPDYAAKRKRVTGWKGPLQ